LPSAPIPVSVSTPPSDPAEPALPRRAALGTLAGAGIYGASLATFGWGTAFGRLDFQLEELVVKVAGWPRALDGYVIAQVSDIHVGTFIRERELRMGFELVRRAKPDLVVATGDLVDFMAEAAGPLARALVDVDARDGAVAIVGNHDHYAGPDEVIARLRAGGVRVLHNEGVVVRPKDGGGFALLGVDDLQGRRRPLPGFAGPDLSLALAQVPRDLPRILLAHQPNFFRESAGRVALQLSGHTHGGQIRPFTTPVTAFWDFLKGRYERDGSTLYVNRGFGTSGPPSRVGAPPEVTRIVVVSA
jgi:predicted MPP superfamily phosphohydrolase